MFITQTYDSNEYEGDVNVYGDDEWDSDVELLHACGSMGYICPNSSEVSIVKKTITGGFGFPYLVTVFVDSNGNDITDSQCCQTLGGAIQTDNNSDSYCSVQYSKSLYE